VVPRCFAQIAQNNAYFDSSLCVVRAHYRMELEDSQMNYQRSAFNQADKDSPDFLPPKPASAPPR
jgi:hypothetical protein